MEEGINFWQKEFWNKKELSYQCVHFLIAFAGSTVLGFLTNIFWIGILVMILVPIALEIKQYFVDDKRKLVIQDRVRDLIFWSLGACSVMLWKIDVGFTFALNLPGLIK